MAVWCPRLDQTVCFRRSRTAAFLPFFLFRTPAGRTRADFGLIVVIVQIGLQTLARSLVYHRSTDDAPLSTLGQGNHAGPPPTPPRPPSAAIITTLPASAIVGPLQKAVRLQVLERRRKRADLGYDDDDGDDDSSGHDRSQYPSAAAAAHDVNAEVRACLARVSISRVFDVVGLWQVLDEIEVSSRPRGPKRGGSLSQEERKAGCSDDDESDEGYEGDEGDDLMAPPPPQQGASTVEGEEAYAVKTGAARDGPPRAAEATRLPSPATSLPPLRPPVPVRVEVSDSEDDDDALSSPPASVEEVSEPRKEAVTEAKDHEADRGKRVSRDPDGTQTTQRSTMPDMILVTHFSTLLSALFTQSGTDRASAHTTLQLLSTHIRYLARSSDSVVMLLNTTTAITTSSDASRLSGLADPDAPPADLVAKDSSRGNMNMNLHNRSSRPLDPTLRSIFNPAPTTGDAGPGAGGHGSYGAAGNMISRRNKPTFGLTFAQFLDVHLLCTRLPRTRADAEAMVSTTGRYNDLRNDDRAVEGAAVPATATGRGAVEYCWVVEVLLDELGVWAAGSLGGETARRVNREQRWGAVRVDRESGVVENAFDGDEANKRYQMRVDQGPIRLAAGFGGRRV